MSSPVPTARLRRTWPQRLLIAFNVVAIISALAIAGAVAWGKDTVGEVPRIQIRSSEFTPASELAAGDPVNFLIVGTDDATGLDPNDPLLDGREDVGGTRSDVTMVVRLDPKHGTASVVSFPRDLWVKIPGHGSNRINSAIAYGEGDPALLIDTLKENFGISINHYVEVNFAAFKNVVSQIGGVKVYISHPLRDGRAQLNIPQAGCQVLDKDQALAYSRSRHLQWQDANGRWRSDPTGDLGRIKRQQDFVRRTIAQAIDKGARNPATLARLIRTGVKHVTLDPYTTPQDLIDLGRAFDTFEPDELKTIEIPVVNATRGGAAVLDAVEPETTELLAPFRGTVENSGEVFDPSTIDIRVANGTHRPGEGAATTDRLAAAGFKVLDPRDADALAWRTTITYQPAAEAQARFVARYLDADPILVPDPEQGTEILVTTGPDFVGVLDTPKDADQKLEVMGTTTTLATTTTTVTADSSEAAVTTSTAAPTTTTSTTLPPSSPVYVPAAIPAGEDC
ncbi:MAG: LCP family protein [Acidimicrobiales bacterium]|nr:LCP family protein [Acidimicrobiales bacterium]